MVNSEPVLSTSVKTLSSSEPPTRLTVCSGKVASCNEKGKSSVDGEDMSMGGLSNTWDVGACSEIGRQNEKYLQG